MLEAARGWWVKVITPFCKLLLRIGITPDVVTWVGTVVTTVIALWCFPQGMLWQGALLVALFVLADSLDGTMSRIAGTSSNWGAFLDSTLDRLSDGAIFGALAMYLAFDTGDEIWTAMAICALALGQVTSYSKARGESLGYAVKGGIAGRADRLVIGLTGAFATGLGVSWALPAALTILVVTGLITVGQRMMIVYRQAKASGQTADQLRAQESN